MPIQPDDASVVKEEPVVEPPPRALLIAPDSIEFIAQRVDVLERLIYALPPALRVRPLQWVADFRFELARASNAARKREDVTQPELPQVEGGEDDF